MATFNTQPTDSRRLYDNRRDIEAAGDPVVVPVAAAAGVTAGAICAGLLLLATVIMVAIGLAWLSAINSDISALHMNTLCGDDGEACTDAALVGGAGVCSQGECTGTPLGQCDAFFEFEPQECRNLTYSWPVSTFNLFNIKICYLDMCLHFLDPGAPYDWACAGVDHGYHERISRAAKRCRAHIYNDVDKHEIESTATCVSNSPICEFSYTRANYPRVQPLIAPFSVAASENSIRISGAAGLRQASEDLKRDTIYAYVAEELEKYQAANAP